MEIHPGSPSAHPAARPFRTRLEDLGARGRCFSWWVVLTVALATSCAIAPPPGARPQAVLVLPPSSAHLDPLVAEATKQGLKEPDRKLLVDVVQSALPIEIREHLTARGVRAIVLRPDELASTAGEDLETLEQRLSYEALAASHGADRVLKLGYDGSIRRGAGSVELLGGTMVIDYPSDTSWLELRIQATLVDPANPENLQRFEVAGRRHTELFSMLGGATERDRLVSLTRDLTDELVDHLLGE